MNVIVKFADFSSKLVTDVREVQYREYFRRDSVILTDTAGEEHEYDRVHSLEVRIP